MTATEIVETMFFLGDNDNWVNTTLIVSKLLETKHISVVITVKPVELSSYCMSGLYNESRSFIVLCLFHLIHCYYLLLLLWRQKLLKTIRRWCLTWFSLWLRFIGLTCNWNRVLEKFHEYRPTRSRQTDRQYAECPTQNETSLRSVISSQSRVLFGDFVGFFILAVQIKLGYNYYEIEMYLKWNEKGSYI